MIEDLGVADRVVEQTGPIDDPVMASPGNRRTGDVFHEHGVLTEAEFAAEKRLMRARRHRILVAGPPADGLAPRR